MLFFKIALSLIIAITPLMTISCVFSENKLDSKQIKEYKVNIIRQIDHKGPRLFTQGLEIYKGYLYEGTGLVNQTCLKKIDLKTGRIIRQKNLEDYFPYTNMYFGEGITIWKDKIIQLSWQRKIAYVYSLDFKQTPTEFSYNTEGWGLTHNKQYLIMSDGTNYLYFRNPDTFEIVRKLNVGIKNLNELEYVDGIIYANIWKEAFIIMISEQTGKIIGKINAKDLLCSTKIDQDAVLNGIAYNTKTKTFYITGKNCPVIYEASFEAIP